MTKIKGIILESTKAAQSGRKKGKGCLRAQVEAEDGGIQQVLLQHALHHRGGTAGRQGREGQPQDAIEGGVHKVGARLGLTQAELLVGDGEALDLGMERKGAELT